MAMGLFDLDSLDSEGFCLTAQVVDESVVQRLLAAVDSVVTTRPNSRNARRLLETCPAVAELARSRAMRQWVEPVLGPDAFVVRGLLFDKVAGANWHVAWHQDLMIPVVEAIPTPGFDAWSTKEGVAHVRPPAEVLEGMLTLRLHLDDCPGDNGPLLVLSGSHRWGRLTPDEIQQRVSQQSPTVCTAAAGDLLLMRPLLLHASQPSTAVGHRRVVHLEFASRPLPGDLQWWRPLG